MTIFDELISIEWKKDFPYILDPTKKFETDASQRLAGDKEKRNICEPTIPLFKEKYEIGGELKQED